MAKKKTINKGLDMNDALTSIGDELNPSGNWKEHLMIAGVLGAIFLTLIAGVWIAFATGVISEPPPPPPPAPTP